LIEQGFARTSAVAALGIGEQHPAAQALRFSGRELVGALGAIEAQADQQERRGQQGGASDAGIAAQEVDREFHAAATIVPAALQGLQGEVGNGEEAGLASGMGDKVLEVEAQVDLKTVFRAIGLEGLEHVQGTTPLGGDLGKGKIRAP